MAIGAGSSGTGTAVAAPVPRPTNLAALPRLLAYPQSLDLADLLHHRQRGIAVLVLALLWLVLAWRGRGRPQHLATLDDPVLLARLGLKPLPTDRTLRRRLRPLSAHGVRRAVETAYLAEVAKRAGRVWAAIDAHQIPAWGRGQLDRFQKGWSGSHSRRVRGYRLYLVIDTDTSQVITYVLARGRKRDQRLLAGLAQRARSPAGPTLGGHRRRLRLHQPRLGGRLARGADPLHSGLCPLRPNPPAAGGAQPPATPLDPHQRSDPAGRVCLGRPPPVVRLGGPLADGSSRPPGST